MSWKRELELRCSLERLLDESAVTRRGGAPVFSSRRLAVGSEMDPENGRLGLKTEEVTNSRECSGEDARRIPGAGGGHKAGCQGRPSGPRSSHIFMVPSHPGGGRESLFSPPDS